MSIIVHDTGIAAPRNTAVLHLGPFARDVLALVWANSGITIASVAARLGDESRRTKHTMFNLRRQGVVCERATLVDGHRCVRWCIADAALAAKLLQAPPRGRLRATDGAWDRCIPDPDFLQAPAPMPELDPAAFELELMTQRERAAVKARATPSAKQAEQPATRPPRTPAPQRQKFVEPRVSFGPAPRARQESPSFTCDAARHLPVVRAGSLDALRLRSLRWATDRGTPEVRMAVVEASGVRS